MSDSNYDGGPFEPMRLYRLACCVDLLLAALVVAGWPLVGPLLADPMGEAFASSMSASSQPGLDEYPYVFLWTMPVLAVFAAWVLKEGGRRKLARLVSVYPVGVLALVLVWYYGFSTVYS
ncbi:MAG: hypothetical protein R3D33_17865 [Hyphomicrobiaceae bacterium]